MAGFIALGTAYIEQFSYAAVFLFLILSGTGFFPFPEDVTLLIAGYLLSLSIVKLPILLPITVLGLLLGDSIWYFIGRRHPHSLIKYGKYIFLTTDMIKRLHKFFKAHGKKTVFLTRFMLGFRMYAAFIAGSTGMKYSTYAFYQVAGGIIWSSVLITIGYGFGTYIDQILLGVRGIRHAAFIIFAIMVTLWIGYHYVKHIIRPSRKSRT